MQLGIFVALAHNSPSVTALAPAIEERGFESLWVPEHTHIPTASVLADGRAVPRAYADLPDPLVLLAAAAAVTQRIKLGTGVCLLIQRDTIITAKSVATLSQLSGGRVLLGVGAGWNKLELANHGVEFSTRFKKLEEQVQALRAIWRDDEPQFQGRHVAFGPLWSGLKPVAGQLPKVLFGGESEHTLRRVVKHGDGWLPRMYDAGRVAAGMTRLRELASEAGRDPASLSINLFATRPEADLLKAHRDAGADRAILTLTAGTMADCQRRLDRLAALALQLT
jgi:probable F420-dependent oxidoreductase